MFSQQPAHDSTHHPTLGADRRPQRRLPDRTRQRHALLHRFHDQAIEHPQEGHWPVIHLPNPHGIDDPHGRRIARLLHDDIAQLQIAMKQPAVHDRRQRLTHRSGTAPRRRVTVTRFGKHLVCRAPFDVPHLQTYISSIRDPRQTPRPDHLRRPDPGLTQQPGTAHLALRLRDPQHQLDQQRPRRPPQLHRARQLLRSLHQPHTRSAVVDLQTAHGMRRPGLHECRIPPRATPVAVVVLCQHR